MPQSRRLRLMQVRKYAAEQDAISAEAKALVKRSRQKEAANTKLWEEVHKAAQVRSGLAVRQEF